MEYGFRLDSFTQHLTFINTKKSLPEKDGIYLCLISNGVYQLLHYIDSCFYFWDSDCGKVIYSTKNVVAWAELPSSMGLLNYFKME